MESIARQHLDIAGDDPWSQVVTRVQSWALSHGVVLRDAIVLLPFAQQLPIARRAWAREGGWMPRIETTQTLARSLGPAPGPESGQISFDAALDRLVVRSLLRPRDSTWAQADPRGLEHAVEAVVQTAHAMARAAATLAPSQRDAYWRRAREWLGIGSAPGAMERVLARVALEWAAGGAAPVTDRLFLLRPSAWIAIQAGGPDPLVLQLLSHHAGGTPAFLLDTDVLPGEPFADVAGQVDAQYVLCADFEEEAQCSAAQVLTHIQQGQRPVALIAQDRLLVRRVRALLSHQHVRVQDETGWKLSTTRAAATVAALLRAARPGSTADDWLDWLKCCTSPWPGLPDPGRALQRLEALSRRHGWVTPAAVDAARLPEHAAALWGCARHAIEEFAPDRTRAFGAWLASLHSALEACGALQALQDDDAGRQVLAVLHLGAPASFHADVEAMTMEEFAAWVDKALEDASFVPEAPPDADVVITPLEHAMLRPFGSVVLAGADEKRLGAMPAPYALLSEALATSLGLPTAAARRDVETLAFAQLLRLPRITFLRRLEDGGEPLAPSPLVERLRLALQRAGRGEMRVAPDPRVACKVAAQPTQRPRPSAPDLLPQRLSASACEALRACPYRFFALRLLALHEAPELDDEVQKRDYGSWLHKVLHRFHGSRDAPLPAEQEQARLQAVARQVQEEMRLDDASFLPYAASFDRFAPRYVAWLHARDREGAQWLDGEREFIARPAQWGGTQMHGIIDRIDSMPSEDGPVTQLIDYKTGSSQVLRAQVKQAQEDTQLAFYAALVAEQSPASGDIGAMYLPLDDADGIKPIEHQDVQMTALQLVEGIGLELDRLRKGSVLPALGEGRACEYCEARGLCRRDDWIGEEG